jgi:hypothetical protein
MCNHLKAKSFLLKGGVLYLVFCPRTFLQCFALAHWESKAKHYRNVQGYRSFRDLSGSESVFLNLFKPLASECGSIAAASDGCGAPSPS